MTETIPTDVEANVSTTPTEPPHAARKRARIPVWAELGAVAIAPVVVFFAYGVQRMAPVVTIDPTLYTAYMQNGPDLLQRFGSEQYYYWTRLGMVLPGRVSYLLFGSVGGFYVWRYVLALIAIVPAYLLFRRLRGPGAGAIAVAVILVNPVILRAWGSDYPDSAAIAYLLGGTACLLMPARSSRVRWSWIVAAAVFFTAGVNCNLVVSALVACTLLSYAAVYGLREPRRLLLGAVVMGAVFFIAAGALVIGAKIMLGAGDIIAPNQRAIDELQGGLAATFHSTTWRWLLRETHLFVVPLVLLAWVLVRGVLRRSALGGEETVAFLSLLLQGLVFAVWQFARDGSTLENYLYASLLWAGTSMLLAFVLVTVWDRIHWKYRYPATFAAVLLTPYAFHLLSWEPRFTVLPWVPLLLGVVAAVALAARRSSAHVAAGSCYVALFSVVTILAVAFVFTVGKPQNRPLLEGQAIQPQASYGDVLFDSGNRFVDYYRVATGVPRAVPKEEDEPGRLFMWWDDQSSDLVQMAASMYLWRVNGFVGFDFAPEALLQDPPRFVMLLGDDAAGFDRFAGRMRQVGFTVDQRWDRTLRSGDAVLSQRLLELTPPPTASTAASESGG